MRKMLTASKIQMNFQIFIDFFFPQDICNKIPYVTLFLLSGVFRHIPSKGPTSYSFSVFYQVMLLLYAPD